MATVHFVKKARKTIRGTDIRKGDSYYWWQLYNREKQVSKTPPRDSQIVGSPFLSEVYSLLEGLEDLTADSGREEIQEAVQEVIDRCNELAEEQDEKKSNMPDSLQEGPTGELLSKRADDLRDMVSALEGIDFEDDDLESVVEEVHNVSYDGE